MLARRAAKEAINEPAEPELSGMDWTETTTLESVLEMTASGLIPLVPELRTTVPEEASTLLVETAPVVAEEIQLKLFTLKPVAVMTLLQT